MVDIHSDEYIIGQNIRKYRKQKGWSQKDLSDAVDVDRANISGIENGERGVMNCVMLKRFARALGVSMDTLMDEEDEPPCADTSIQEKYDMSMTALSGGRTKAISRYRNWQSCWLTSCMCLL